MQRQQLMMAQQAGEEDDEDPDAEGGDAGLNTDVSGLAGGRRDVATGNVPPQLAR